MRVLGFLRQPNLRTVACSLFSMQVVLSSWQTYLDEGGFLVALDCLENFVQNFCSALLSQVTS
jgi:hypothetical protein